MQKTIALDLTADLSDWHKGRKYYGLWYIDLDNDDRLKNYCHALQNQLGDILYPNYQRQFHITIFINGFWVEKKYYDDDFSYDKLFYQIHLLKTLYLSSFNLSVVSLGAFLNSVYLAIEPSVNLMNIRHCLAKTHQEISPADYRPHITLGFFKDSYDYKEILDKLYAIKINKMTITVNALTFGIYHACDLQGSLVNQYQFNLLDKT